MFSTVSACARMSWSCRREGEQRERAERESREREHRESTEREHREELWRAYVVQVRGVDSKQ